jgi:hypothetical protein
MSPHVKKTLLWLAIFSIAMGYMETAVVVYARMLYFPEGFDFPMVAIEHDFARTEFFREVATIIMLVGAGVMAGKRAATRFAYFIYCFAIWDIFYYIFLKVLLDWPASLFTWDLRFLVPVPWVGPVIAPVIVSCGLIVLTCVILKFDEKQPDRLVTPKEWLALISGAVILIVSFCWEYGGYVLVNNSFADLFTLSFDDSSLFSVALEYEPERFAWPIFIGGMAACMLGVASIWRRSRQHDVRQLIVT